MASTECVHKFVVDSQNVGTCSKCGEVRQFPMEKGDKPVIMKEGHLETRGRRKRPRPKFNSFSRHDYYNEHREEIVEDLLKMGRGATRLKWKIPKGSMGKIVLRFLTVDQLQQLNVADPALATEAPALALPGPDHQDNLIPLALTVSELQIMINVSSRQLQADITRNIFDRSLTGLVQKGADAMALKLQNDVKEKTPA
jgi:hypothetical protein